jgi:hypothetical protein
MQIRKGKNGCESTAPTIFKWNLGDGCIDMRVNYRRLISGYSDMARRQMSSKTKNKHVPSQKKIGRSALKVAAECFDKDFCRRDRHPSCRVGWYLFGLRTDHLTPYAA